MKRINLLIATLTLATITGAGLHAAAAPMQQPQNGNVVLMPLADVVDLAVAQYQAIRDAAAVEVNNAQEAQVLLANFIPLHLAFIAAHYPQAYVEAVTAALAAEQALQQN